MYFLFDTETTGIPKNWNVSPAADPENWPNIVSVTVNLLDSNLNQIDYYSAIIKPDGYEIPLKSIEIHGITNEMAEKEGLPAKHVLSTMELLAESARIIVAHNVSFDMPVTIAAFLREYGSAPHSIVTKPTFCTMKSTTNFCKIPAPKGRGYKWPSLSELHKTLFGHDFSNAHSSAGDVQAMTDCFIELKKLKLIEI